MLDMIAVAFQSDTTRISTFMFGNAVSNVSFRFLEGVSLGHHDTSHHAKNPGQAARSTRSSTDGTWRSTPICCASCSR